MFCWPADYLLHTKTQNLKQRIFIVDKSLFYITFNFYKTIFWYILMLLKIFAFIFILVLAFPYSLQLELRSVLQSGNGPEQRRLTPPTLVTITTGAGDRRHRQSCNHTGPDTWWVHPGPSQNIFPNIAVQVLAGAGCQLDRPARCSCSHSLSYPVSEPESSAWVHLSCSGHRPVVTCLSPPPSHNPF